jgi:uncharacterized LabA/DUF88 family protein
MAYRVRVFIDFWNFQLNWNSRLPSSACNWPQVPITLVRRAGEALASAGISGSLQLEETRVYASHDPGSQKEAKLSNWLSNFLDRQPSFRVFVRERAVVARRVRCRECGMEMQDCPQCGKRLLTAREKGVDTAIVTDLLSLAWERAYDVAVLVSSDADLVPAVARLQEKGFKIINAAWTGIGHELAKTCWASFAIEAVANELVR